MMASFMSYFGGRRDAKQAARDAIVGLRQQLQMLEKKEEHLQKKIEEDMAKARVNAVSNKAVATQALRRKKMNETELSRIEGARMQLESQMNTLESANLNLETMSAMKKGSDALKTLHGNMYAPSFRLPRHRAAQLTDPFFMRYRTPETVDGTMSAINEQRELANEISEAISNPLYAGVDIDEDELKNELAELEQEDLNERLRGADRVPITTPAGMKEPPSRHRTAEEEEEAELRALQAELAM
ncbi:hypothetical protein EWM64_g4686 [Hericium alpestre]|uniref:Vacuolar-sorting protein SNF7 n=1 Tax=Hericium alpestre TaxID=135208 RepID=A0A4Y9ZYP7_9AGAM|nr:hypothetical protein EWM64_g4686 [Hericium alpestre]